MTSTYEDAPLLASHPRSRSLLITLHGDASLSIEAFGTNSLSPIILTLLLEELPDITHLIKYLSTINMNEPGPTPTHAELLAFYNTAQVERKTRTKAIRWPK